MSYIVCPNCLVEYKEDWRAEFDVCPNCGAGSDNEYDDEFVYRF